MASVDHSPPTNYSQPDNGKAKKGKHKVTIAVVVAMFVANVALMIYQGSYRQDDRLTRESVATEPEISGATEREMREQVIHDMIDEHFPMAAEKLRDGSVTMGELSEVGDELCRSVDGVTDPQELDRRFPQTIDRSILPSITDNVEDTDGLGGLLMVWRCEDEIDRLAVMLNPSPASS